MRVAAIQTTAGSERERNLDAAVPLVEEAARAGAELVVLPEYFSVAGTPDVLRRYAEPLDGPTYTWASHQARRWNVRVVAGTFPERPEESSGAAPGHDRTGRRLFNTSCLIGPTGRLEAVYRKVHLFDVELDGVTICESATFAPGEDLCVAPLSPPSEPTDSAPPMLGLSICYDLRFPELYRILTLLGATVVAVPSAFTAATGPAHWELLLRARAVENQVFVIGAGQVGDLPPGMPSCHGHSMIVDPWGTIMAERLDPTPGVVVADLDAHQQRRIRSDLPVLAHRRPTAYRWPDDRGR
ncbi:MAG TPA: carbon-nitrogen hydrolase family protein [Acidimicrobiales bacterium]|jgi:predicted amidohydrolase|nr:carbon-nitrogen hydrolase family protein [Acidimicrobiales bacterium]